MTNTKEKIKITFDSVKEFKKYKNNIQKKTADKVLKDVADIIPWGLLISHGWNNDKWIKLKEKYKNDNFAKHC